MTVSFETRRTEFPPNVTDLTLKHVVLYVIRASGEEFEVAIDGLQFRPDGASSFVGGPARTLGGRASTRSASGVTWSPMLGRLPFGQWELAFADDEGSEIRPRDLLRDGRIEDILLVLSVEGKVPKWPL